MAELPTAQRSVNARQGRRLRSRAFTILTFVFTAIVLVWFFESQATTTILFVRHADTGPVDPPTDDPPLSVRGRFRAELLADFLETVDVVSGVDAIYASDDRRTRETAEPIASRLGLPVVIADARQIEAFMQEVLRAHKGHVVLVVTHAELIAPLVEELHGSKHIKIGPDDYDGLYVVTIPWFGKVKTLHFRYGVGVPFDDFERYFELNDDTRSQLP